MKVFIAVVAFLACGAFGLEFDRPCRTDVEAKERFSPAFYTGTWFELYNSLDEGAECIEHHYTRRGIQHVFDTERVGHVDGVGFLRETGVASVAFPDDDPLLAIFNATLTRITGGVMTYNYRIIATDYTNYSVYWTCTDIANNRSVEEGAVLGRGTSLNDASYVKVDALLASVGLDRTDFRFILHTPTACGHPSE